MTGVVRAIARVNGGDRSIGSSYSVSGSSKDGEGRGEHDIRGRWRCLGVVGDEGGVKVTWSGCWRGGMVLLLNRRDKSTFLLLLCEGNFRGSKVL